MAERKYTVTPRGAAYFAFRDLMREGSRGVDGAMGPSLALGVASMLARSIMMQGGAATVTFSSSNQGDHRTLTALIMDGGAVTVFDYRGRPLAYGRISNFTGGVDSGEAELVELDIGHGADRPRSEGDGLDGELSAIREGLLKRLEDVVLSIGGKILCFGMILYCYDLSESSRLMMGHIAGRSPESKEAALAELRRQHVVRGVEMTGSVATGTMAGEGREP